MGFCRDPRNSAEVMRGSRWRRAPRTLEMRFPHKNGSSEASREQRVWANAPSPHPCLWVAAPGCRARGEGAGGEEAAPLGDGAWAVLGGRRAQAPRVSRGSRSIKGTGQRRHSTSRGWNQVTAQASRGLRHGPLLSPRSSRTQRGGPHYVPDAGCPSAYLFAAVAFLSREAQAALLSLRHRQC